MKYERPLVYVNMRVVFGFSAMRIVDVSLYGHYFTVYVQTDPL
jgi:hypothetical protein